nr:GDP-mannose 4,6-dehydratase [Candidatus Eremiobacteraeota bacterium]
ASKAAGEAIVLGECASYGIDAIITRAFNHIGPGQSDRFVVPSFAAQLAGIARGAEKLMYVGNLDAKREFLDVRDVVEAYIALAEHGESGQVYNVCTGRAVSIREVLGELINISHVAVEVRNDPARMRPSDTPLSVGDNTKLREATGWEPRITLRRSLQDVYDASLSKIQ